MWVPGSGSWVFGEIGGLRKMSGGDREMLIFKYVWEYFCQVGAVQMSILSNLFKCIDACIFYVPVFSLYYCIGVGGTERSPLNARNLIHPMLPIFLHISPVWSYSLLTRSEALG